MVWVLTSFSYRFHCFQSRFLAKRVFALLICCNVFYLCCCKCVVKNLFFVFECLWLLCFCVVFCMFWLHGVLMVCYCVVRQDVFTWKCLLRRFQNYVVINLFGSSICVASCFMSFVAQPRVLCSFHLGRHVQMVSLILKGVTNVLCVSPLQVDLPERDAVICLNVCMFHRHSCCHKRGVFCLKVCIFAFVSSQTYCES